MFERQESAYSGSIILLLDTENDDSFICSTGINYSYSFGLWRCWKSGKCIQWLYYLWKWWLDTEMMTHSSGLRVLIIAISFDLWWWIPLIWGILPAESGRTDISRSRLQEGLFVSAYNPCNDKDNFSITTLHIHKFRALRNTWRMIKRKMFSVRPPFHVSSSSTIIVRTE